MDGSDWSAGEHGSDRSKRGVAHATGKSEAPIKIKPSKVGSLHEALSVPQGDKIPAKQLQLKPLDSPALVKKKTFAKNARN